MSVVAVKGVPLKWTLNHMMSVLTKVIKGPFEALNFARNKNNKSKKIFYLRLSEKLDPLQVVEKINRTPFPKAELVANVAQDVPDLPLPQKLRRILKMPEEFRPEQVLVMTHVEILKEMQLKYTGLFHLAKKTDFKLLDDIAETIFHRLKDIIVMNEKAVETCFNLSKCYRRMHPHFGDFQLILSTLHRLQDAAGQPREQLLEAELTAADAQVYGINNIPYHKVQSACSKYSDRIVKKITDHINSLKSEINVETDTKEDIARKRVREELKKLNPYLPTIVQQVVSKHVMPSSRGRQKIMMYGEPFLPPRDVLAPWLRPAPRVLLRRSQRAFNLTHVVAPPAHVAALLALDGSVVGGAKLIIRSSNVPLYKIPKSLIAKMKAVFGVVDKEDDTALEDEAMAGEEMDVHEDGKVGDEEVGDEVGDENAVDEDDPETWAEWA